MWNTNKEIIKNIKELKEEWTQCFENNEKIKFYKKVNVKYLNQLMSIDDTGICNDITLYPSLRKMIIDVGNHSHHYILQRNWSNYHQIILGYNFICKFDK